VINVDTIYGKAIKMAMIVEAYSALRVASMVVSLSFSSLVFAEPVN